MRNYLVKTPRILKAAYNRGVWHVDDAQDSVFITFDDGPHPDITPFVLDELKKADAKATFFCIGKNVEKYPDIYQRILDEGHQVGNHTQNHKNGWSTNNTVYYRDILHAAKLIDSNLFRPPYGRITYAQGMGIEKLLPDTKIIMWDVLSGDFDTELSPEDCLKNVTSHTKEGSIIVFHDSEKAFDRLKYALPKFLAHCQSQHWKMKALNL
jgi:peptidoglycan/xylan/chitin deacetylase (PgdA/CDA1 family)